MTGAEETALISGAASIIGSGASAVGQASLNKKTREFNREEAEKQRQWTEQMYNAQNAWNYEMWQKQNEYNTPAEQVQRLRDAGLNPLFYGLENSGNAGDLSSAQPLGYERASIQNQVNPLGDMQDVALKVAQVANIQADTAKKKRETASEEQRREKLIADIEVARQELQNKRAQEGLTKSQKEEIDKRITWLDRLNEATLAEKESQAKLNDSTRNRIDTLLENEKLIQSKTLQDFEEKWKKIRAEISKIAKETGLLEKDLENYGLNHASNGFMGTGLSLQNLIRGADSVSSTISQNPKVKEGKSILAEDSR